jgi:hypothetical protein
VQPVLDAPVRPDRAPQPLSVRRQARQVGAKVPA